MKTLYDLLGALPDDDAEDLRIAFRKAVKANHPDVNPDNPEASHEFRRIIRANAILSDGRQREAYDRLLALLPFRKRLDDERTMRAQKYAYHFFFRRMIRVPGLKRSSVQGAPYGIGRLKIGCFTQNASAALDCICDGILKGTPFIFERDIGAA